MTIYVIEHFVNDQWEPVRDSAGQPLMYIRKEGARRALSSLPHHLKGKLVHYRITRHKD